MPRPDQVEKYSLECLRLEADCRQLAEDADSDDAKTHFLRMASIWADLAASGPSANASQESTAAPHAILIVDDDQFLKFLTADMLEADGFVVLQASNADEAVAILESRSDVALLLTDINMPGSMDGLKLAHAVRNRWPPIKIIVVSARMRLSDDDLPTDSCFFAKPYSSDALVSEIRSLIRP